MEAREEASLQEETGAEVNSQTALATAIDQIRHLLAESDVEGARSLAADLHQHWPDDADVAY